MGVLTSAGLNYFWGKIKGYIDQHSAGGGIPSGLVAMWSGAADAIPAGWALCDGSNGTPDLRGRFILGSTDEVDEEGNTAHQIGETGGEATHTLTEDEMPQHGHVETLTTNKYEYVSATKKYMSYVSIYPMIEHFEKSGAIYARILSRAPKELKYTESDAYNEDCYYVNLFDNVSSGNINPVKNSQENRATYIRYAKTFDVGSSEAHNNMPPYYVLCYIMKL